MFNKESYLPRLIDKKIKKLIDYFGAILIEDPKWCGKTWTGLNNSKSHIMLSNPNEEEKIKFNNNEILTGNYPVLIDEWQMIPKIWDFIRYQIDSINKSGLFILTCSTSIIKYTNEINHSGAEESRQLRCILWACLNQKILVAIFH